MLSVPLNKHAHVRVHGSFLLETLEISPASQPLMIIFVFHMISTETTGRAGVNVT